MSRCVAAQVRCLRGDAAPTKESTMKYAKRTQKYVNYATVDDAAASQKFDLVQPKYDGWWACVAIKRGVAAIYSRQGMLKATADAKKAPDCVLIGEYLVGTQRAVGTKSEGKLMVFDAVEVGRHAFANEYEYRERLSIAKRIVRDVAWMEPTWCYDIETRRVAWQECLAARGEGLVFRNQADLYGTGAIGRVKRTFTVDYVVMDVLPGEGKHKGRMGAVVCGLFEGRELVQKVRVGGGWSDQQRHEIWRRPGSYIGRVLEVRGWQVFDSGAVRHPSAVRFRDDKSPTDCVWHGKETK